jgi:acyl-homoserine lactone acylase PvdQ
VGFGIFTYARSKHSAWGVTAVNPDVSDLYVEQVRGDEYLYDGEWHKFNKTRETFKVRFSADQYIDYNFTHNGVMMLKPLVDKLDFAVWFPLEFLSYSN